MRDGATRVDKRRIHLFQDHDSLSDRLSRVDELPERVDHGVPIGFLTGWQMHLVADCLWSKYIVYALWDAHTGDVTAQERKERYYKETDKADFILHRTAPWTDDAWKALRRVQVPSFDGYLSSEEIDGWRHRLLRWFADPQKEPLDDPEFFTTELVADFIEFSAAVLSEGFATSFGPVAVQLEQSYANAFEHWRHEQRPWPARVLAAEVENPDA